MSKTVVVTGGSGFIAGFVIAEFLNHGYQVKTSLRQTSSLGSIKKGLAAYVDEEALHRLSAFEANLNHETGWAEAFRGVDGILHVASPLGSGKESLETLKRTAEGGTLNVLKAAKSADVRRVVMTSSLAASTPMADMGKMVLDESYWSDEANPALDPYRLSKIASEKAAWNYAKDNDLALTTILPGAVFGPTMRLKAMSSNRILLRLMKGKMPKAFNIPFEVSDVRDLATLHRLAFEQEVAIGQRFLAASQIITMPEVARLYKVAYPDCKAPTSVFSDRAVKILAVFMPELRAMVPMLGRTYKHTTEKAESLLGWTQRQPRDTLLDAAKSFEQHGLL